MRMNDDETVVTYLENLKHDGKWGREETIVSTANISKVKINILQSTRPIITYIPEGEQFLGEIHLQFTAYVPKYRVTHFGSRRWE
jgi:hypothetical protein